MASLSNSLLTAGVQDCFDDSLDIVATQGAFLIPRAGTPVFQEAYDSQFISALEIHLRAVIIEQKCRSAMYHSAADEWPMGHTPLEVKEKRRIEVKALKELEDAMCDKDSDNDDDKEDRNTEAITVEDKCHLEKSGIAISRLRRLREPHRGDLLRTPPLSPESVVAAPRKRKRRKHLEEDGEEKGRLSKKHISNDQRGYAAVADNSQLNATRRKGRKRRQDLRAGDKEEASTEMPGDILVNITRPGDMWLQRL